MALSVSGRKALLLAALIVASSRLLHGPTGCSASAGGAGSTGRPELPPPTDARGEEEGGGGDKQQLVGGGEAEALPFRGPAMVRAGAQEMACRSPAGGAVGRFHQAMLVALLAHGGGRVVGARWRSSRRRG